MEKDALYELRNRLKEKLSEKRFQHSIGVEYTAACLAMKYNADVSKAELAGLLHDCAKEYPDEYLYRICRNENASAKTIHAVCGPVIAEKEYGIRDPEVLSAIRWHTTGKAGMSLLDKIIFVADFIEPGRSFFPLLSEIRKTAFEDLTYSVYKISEETIPYVISMNYKIDNNTVECYEWLKENGIHDRQ